jgi:hypothetical protein
VVCHKLDHWSSIYEGYRERLIWEYHDGNKVYPQNFWWSIFFSISATTFHPSDKLTIYHNVAVATSCWVCKKRKLVKIRSSLLLTITYKCTKHYCSLQAFLQKLQTFTSIFKNTKVIKMPSLLKLGLIKTVHKFKFNEITSNRVLIFKTL